MRRTFWGWAALLVALAVLTAALVAASSYTAPLPSSSRRVVGWPPNRYAVPIEGLMIVDVNTTVADQTLALDPDLCGYLERVVIDHNGNDLSWSLRVKDAHGVQLFAKNALNAAADPNSYAVSHTDPGGTRFAGVPFFGGLSIRIANANDRAGDAIAIRLYIREAWRR
jgi:hypothetical protein